MTVIEKIENLFETSPSGLVSLHKLTEVTQNTRLIREIAHRKGFREVFKPRSKKILGYGNYLHAQDWRYTDGSY